jgi:Sulfotransferase family
MKTEHRVLSNQPASDRPVFVMGLPRSGSTLLSRILNNSPDILSVNDLYFIQHVLTNRAAHSVLSMDQAKTLTDSLLKVIDTRANANTEFLGQFKISGEKIEAIRKEVLQSHEVRPMRWSELMDAILSRVAAGAGKVRWADKTPQNFYHFDLIHAHFSDACFVFLFRDPLPILASYKYSAGEGHDSRRYHPVTYALYWRSAVRYFKKFQSNPRVIMIRYEDLLNCSDSIYQRLATFLSTSISHTDISALGSNSSFGDKKRRTINPTEAWLCQRICRREMRDLHYSIDSSRPRLRDIPELAFISLRFAQFHLKRIVFDTDARQRIGAYIRGLKV